MCVYSPEVLCGTHLADGLDRPFIVGVLGGRRTVPNDPGVL